MFSGGSVVVEKIQNTAPFSCLQTYQTTPKGPVTPPPRNEERGTRNEERGTRNEERETRNEERETRNEKRETRNEERGTRNEKRETRNKKRHRRSCSSTLTIDTNLSTNLPNITLFKGVFDCTRRQICCTVPD